MRERAAANATTETDGLGDRVRSLRRAAGLSQSELAGGRFSKEYMSQLERGKTRPSRETIAWLAARLGADVSYLETGVSTLDRERAEAALETATVLLEARRYGEAVAAHRVARSLGEAAGAGSLVFHALTGEARARLEARDAAPAAALVEKARGIAERERLDDLALAEVAYLDGFCLYTTSAVEAAIVSLDRALALAGRSGRPCDRLRSDILDKRSRCYRRLRDIEAAREDAEGALELARADGDGGRRADALFQAALVAQREGRWLLARTRAREAHQLYEKIGDAAGAARILNNLAGLEHLLGNRDAAVGLLHEAFDRFVGLGLDDAAYALSSLAEIYVDEGDADRAEPLARRALVILDDRVEHLAEIGTAHLSLGRALLRLGRAEEASQQIRLAEEAFVRAASPSHQAEAWLADGDLARAGGDDREAARLYRRAALALQDAHPHLR